MTARFLYPIFGMNLTTTIKSTGLTGFWPLWLLEIRYFCTCGQSLMRLLNCHLNTFFHISESVGGITFLLISYSQTLLLLSLDSGFKENWICKHMISLEDLSMGQSGIKMWILMNIVRNSCRNVWSHWRSQTVKLSKKEKKKCKWKMITRTRKIKIVYKTNKNLAIQKKDLFVNGWYGIGKHFSKIKWY